MALSENEMGQLNTALALGHFAASCSAVIAAALHRGKPITDSDIKHLVGSLATAAAIAPEASKPYFDTLAGTLAGKQYEGR